MDVVVVIGDPAPFGERALAWLARRPVVHHVIGTTLSAAWADPRRFGDARWFLVEDTGSLVGLAMRTPPYHLTMTPMEDGALDALVPPLVRDLADLPGVTGEADVIERFVPRWVGRTAALARPGMAQRLYRLDAVTEPGVRPAGALRRARRKDRPVLVDWMRRFVAEAGTIAGAEPGSLVDRALDQGALWVWGEPGPGGPPVSMVAASAPVGGVVRLGPVYTPPGARRQGYAGACVAAVSQWALDEGADACMLYADLANPTSNAVYQRIGYRPVADALEYRFTYPGAPAPP